MLRQEKQDEAIRNTRQTEEVVVTETESQRNVLRERGSSFLDVYIYGKSEIGSDVYRLRETSFLSLSLDARTTQRAALT